MQSAYSGTVPHKRDGTLQHRCRSSATDSNSVRFATQIWLSAFALAILDESTVHATIKAVATLERTIIVHAYNTQLL
eukprot:m.264719 g.264719  ORF g.264719 m.264719 type:complete len:77 (-) comp15621_c0_seq1:161-391(-)